MLSSSSANLIFVVTTSTPSGVEVAYVFLVEALGSSFGGAVVDLPEASREGFEPRRCSLASPFGGGRDQCWKVLVRGVDKGNVLLFPLGDV